MNNILIYIMLGLCCVILFVLLFTLIKDAFFSGRGTPDIKIVKRGKIPTKRVECLHCHSVIEYDTMKVEHEQIMDKYLPYIICPVCDKQIMLGREKGGEEDE